MPVKRELDVEALIHNEQEWRRYVVTKVDDIDKRLIALEILAATLKFKISTISMIFGLVGSGAWQILLAVLAK